MTVLDGIAAAIVSSLLLYLINRIDNMDRHIDTRFDSIEKRLTIVEMTLPKRKGDHYYSENSGIEL